LLRKLNPVCQNQLSKPPTHWLAKAKFSLFGKSAPLPFSRFSSKRFHLPWKQAQQFINAHRSNELINFNFLSGGLCPI
jgi:hypothetical protein